jgi:hypothetical protein
MRFDEVSAQYAEFGDFYVGRIITPKEWVGALVDRRGDRRARKERVVSRQQNNGGRSRRAGVRSG